MTRRHRAFIESRAFSKLAHFDSKATSWKDWAFKFENMAAAVVPSSRESLELAAQQETPILTVDDVEAGPDSVDWQSFWKERRRTLCRTLQAAQVWKLGGNS